MEARFNETNLLGDDNFPELEEERKRQQRIIEVGEWIVQKGSYFKEQRLKATLDRNTAYDALERQLQQTTENTDNLVNKVYLNVHKDNDGFVRGLAHDYSSTTPVQIDKPQKFGMTKQSNTSRNAVNSSYIDMRRTSNNLKNAGQNIMGGGNTYNTELYTNCTLTPEVMYAQMSLLYQDNQKKKIIL